MTDLTTPCLETPTCKNSAGYGHIRFEGRVVRAHRLAYVLANGLELGDIDGIEIRHACDNPGCINPDHLEPGTHTDNMRDMMARGRGKQPKGVKNAKAKLDDDLVREIRAHVNAGGTHREVARSFGIACSSVSRIANRQNWSHVE